MGCINLLPPRLSARIAAGEVIDRPQAVLREFLDNAVDSGADEISVTTDGGGIDRIMVKDNGSGISRDDFSVIASPHATSKIHGEDDLYRITTLGFRGEALYSIASVSTLTISTVHEKTGEKSTLTIDNGERGDIFSTGPERGTVVKSENLFFDIPARRCFLKRSSTEGSLCRTMLLSKALAFPGIGFSLTMDGTLRLRWPKGQTQLERVMMLYRDNGISEADVCYLEEKKEDYTVRIVASGSAIKRSDRKEIRIYVNGRPVEEYSLVQAVIYGYGELLPGGSFPYACVFIEDRSELVDFNIHPAKKEVKLRNLPEIHHTISSMIKNGIERRIPEIRNDRQFSLFSSHEENSVRCNEKPSFSRPASTSAAKAAPETQDTYIRENTPGEKNGGILSERNTEYTPHDPSWLEKAKALKKLREEEKKTPASENEEEKETPDDEIRYIGQAFRLFLICERKNELYLVDQHAAHERILYDEIISQKTVQKLLVPIRIEVDDITDDYLDRFSYVYTKLGIMLSRIKKGEWEIDALPAVCRGIEDTITDYVTSAKSDEHELEEKLFAAMACHAAIKKGDEIDRYSAMDILGKVFRMDEPCCPHGRTFLVRITRETLMEMVGRT